ncbi:MAG: dihydroorotate dehydrogenase [Patescibacteria group bacterium]|nr:dihydroorotate dehydrogenase [Patescibacteria group bacterium]
MELQTEVAGIRLEHPLMNAAGTCRSLEEVKELSRSASAAVMVGSITVEPRTGNTGDVYWAGPMFSLNSLGLPNRGAPYYRETISEMVAVAHGENKPLFVSVAGFSPEEYANLTELAFGGGADLVEQNLGCPNVWQGSTQKRIACFDPALVTEILHRVEERVGADAKVSVKISPLSDPFALAGLAQVIGASKVAKVVTTVNTFPNAFSYNGAKPRITPGGGFAGFAGPAMKPIGLGQVRQLRELLPDRIQIIGVGGITHGKDIREYRESGAVAVQVATAYLERHEQVFSSLLDELLEVASV